MGHTILTILQFVGVGLVGFIALFIVLIITLPRGGGIQPKGELGPPPKPSNITIYQDGREVKLVKVSNGLYKYNFVDKEVDSGKSQ